MPADPAITFAAFTTATDLWRRRGPKFRATGRQAGSISLEPGVGGRLFETIQAASSGAPRVVVSFEAGGTGTRMTVVDHSWAAAYDEHPGAA